MNHKVYSVYLSATATGSILSPEQQGPNGISVGRFIREDPPETMGLFY
jgi:hypothetical protein